MCAFIRTLTITVVAVLSAVALAIGSTLTPFVAAVASSATTALIMGGTGRPNPDDFPGYVPNVAAYYINPFSDCDPPACDLEAVTTPETAWPVYGGPDALTWKQSILQGVEDFDEAVQEYLPVGEDDHLVLFGYSQSGAILAYQKQSLAGLSTTEKGRIEFVVIGNVSRPNGGLNTRLLNFSFPIVEFPFGPAMPTDTGIKTTDIAMKWDIIGDAPLYVTNPLAMFNAILGFEYVHGTYPYPTAATPDGTPGGYTTQQWQWMMDNPTLYPELVNYQEYGDTTYLTVTPTVLPLVAPLHGIGLKPVADLIEPALRVLIEQTGYNRAIPVGQDTGFRLIPIFNPITLAVDLIKAIPQGIAQMIAGLRGEPTWIVPADPDTLTEGASDNSADLTEEIETLSTANTSTSGKSIETVDTAGAEAQDVVDPSTGSTVGEDGEVDPKATTEAKKPLRAFERGSRHFTDRVTKTLQPRETDSDDADSGDQPKSETDTDKRPEIKRDPKADRTERKHTADKTDADAAA